MFILIEYYWFLAKIVNDKHFDWAIEIYGSIIAGFLNFGNLNSDIRLKLAPFSQTLVSNKIN